MKKFKHWLIKKLGGYVEIVPPAIVYKDKREPVKISALISVPFEELKCDRLCADNRVKQELAFKLGKQIIDQGLCRILHSDDYDYVSGCRNFNTSILVIPQGRIERK